VRPMMETSCHKEKGRGQLVTSHPKAPAPRIAN
jgi:hypothetical protein